MQRKQRFWLSHTVEPTIEPEGEAVFEEPPAPFIEQPQEPQAEEQRFSMQDVIAARREEKEKLYPEIDRLKNEVAELARARQEEQQRLEAERLAAEEEAKRKREEEMEVRELLKAKEAEWQSQLEAERQERERAIAMLEKERQYAELQAYRAQRIDEERDEIIPELIDLVSGDTFDEIEASIAGLKERSSRILATAQQAAQSARRDMSGARVTAPPAEPLDNYSGTRQFTADDISNMSIEEFAKYRSTLLGRGEDSGQGLFG